jgi:hypothetical protein
LGGAGVNAVFVELSEGGNEPKKQIIQGDKGRSGLASYECQAAFRSIAQSPMILFEVESTSMCKLT